MNNTRQHNKTLSKREFGTHIESLVRKHLELQDLRLLSANYTRKCGEIDLIFEDESGSIVFVEVRFRKHQHYGGASASVDKTKANKLKRTAHAFLQQYKLTQRPARIDVVAVAPKASNGFSTVDLSHDALPLLSELTIDWIVNAVED